jgi:uncharacterized protein (DUF1697 family)
MSLKTHIALLRGINVGGKNIIKMKDLITICEGIGASHVKTYIQSGNLVFQYPETALPILEKIMGDAVMAAVGFRPAVMVFSPACIAEVMAHNPFPEAIATPQCLQLYFLERPKQMTSIEQGLLQELAIESERFALVNRCFYLHAPEGIGRSKLAAKVERILNVSMTCRNWRTVMQTLML